MANRSLPVVLLDSVGWDFLACNICWWRIRHHGIWISSFAVCSEMIPIDGSCLCCADEALRKKHSDGFIFQKKRSTKNIMWSEVLIQTVCFEPYRFFNHIDITPKSPWIIWINIPPQIQKHMISWCHYPYLIASTTRPWSKRWLQLTWWAVQRSMRQGLPRIHMSFMRKTGRMIWIQSKRCLIVNIFFWEVGGFLH